MDLHTIIAIMLLIILLYRDALATVSDNEGCKQWLRYDRLELLAFKSTATTEIGGLEWLKEYIDPGDNPRDPRYKPKRKRGRRSGLRVRLRKRGSRPPPAQHYAWQRTIGQKQG